MKINQNEFKAVDTRSIKIKKHLEVKLTDEELKLISKNLAYENSQLEEIEDKKKSVNADFTNQITNSKASISILSRKINNGYEYRDIDCEILFHTPNTGKKTIIRKDTGEAIEIIDMTQEEMQEPIFTD